MQFNLLSFIKDIFVVLPGNPTQTTFNGSVLFESNVMLLNTKYCFDGDDTDMHFLHDDVHPQWLTGR